MSHPNLLLLLTLIGSLLSVVTTFRRDNVEYRPPAGLPTHEQQMTKAALPNLHRYSIAQRLGARPRFGSTALPLRQAVERVPSPTERAEEHFPIRDAVEQRPVLAVTPLGQWWNHRMAPPQTASQASSPSSEEYQRVSPLAVDKSVYCFVESWSVYRRTPMSFSADHIDPHLCTHLVYAFAKIDANTHKLTPVDEEYDIVKGGYRSVVFLKRLNPRLKVLLSVAGPFNGMTSSANRRTFISSTVRMLHEYNFDGLDLHWQLPELEGTTPSDPPTRSPADPSTLTRLLEEMSPVFESRAWTLTLSLTGSRFQAEDIYPNDMQQVTTHLTHLLLKSYDLHGERGKEGGQEGGVAVHHAPLQAPPPTQDALALFFNVDYAVRYWLKRGVPRHKLIMGIPLYARTYTLKDANQWQPGSSVLSGGSESRYTQQPGILAYYEVCEKLVEGDGVIRDTSDVTKDANDDITQDSYDITSDDVTKDTSDDVTKNKEDVTQPWRLFRDQGNAPFMVRGDQWVGYEDPLSIQTKMRYINQQKLGGVMVWALDLDDFQGMYCGRKYPLLNAINDHLHAFDWPLAVHQPSLVSVGQAPPTFAQAPPTYVQAPPTFVQAVSISPHSNPLQQSGGVASNAEGQSEGSVSANSQSEASAAPYVLSTPHDGSCRYGQHGFERTNTGHGYRQHKFEASRQHDYEQRQEVVDSYGQHKYEPVNQAYRQHDSEERQEVVDSYGQHDFEQTRREKVYRQHDNELEYWDCSHIFYRCDHLMMHRYLCPIRSAYEPALGKCSVKCPEQKLKEINNNATSQKAELRKKPSHNAVGDKQEPSGPRVVCYFTNWAWYRKGDGKFLPEHIEPSLCTHIIYAFASLDPNDLTLKPFDSWSDIDNNLFARVVTRAAGSGASVLLSMGGWTDSAGSKYSQLVADKGNRRRFVADCVQTLRRHSFDGLQLDWNYPVCWQSNCKKGPAADKANFAKFVQELRQAFDKEKPRLQLSVAISGYREIVDRAYDLRSLSQHADFINVMSFDYHGAWEHETGHVAPLYPTAGEMYPDYNVDSTVKHLIELGADRSKLVVGIPFYGQSFTLAAPDKGNGLGEETVDPGESGEFTKQPGMLAYYEICYKISKQNWKAETSDVGPYAYSGDQWVSYDDPTSIKQKAKYILTEKLGGAMAWTIDLDDFHNRCCKGHTFPLLRALNSGLGRIKGPITSTQDCTKPTLPSTPPPVLTTLTPDNGLVSPEATTEMSSSSTTTTTQSWWTEEPSTSSTTTTTTKPITTKPTTSSTTTTEEEPETTDEEEPEEETTSTTTTTTTTRRPKPSTTKRPKPTRPKPTKPRPSSTTSKPSSSTTSKPRPSSTTSKPSSKPTRPSKPKPPPLPPPTLPPSEEVGATELPSSCTSGEYRADPSDCNAYYRCILGEFRRQRCAGSLHWNSKLQVCDWPQQAKCQTKPGHIESSTSTSTTERPDEWWTQSSSTWWSPELTTPPHHTTTSTTTTSTPWWTPQSTTWWPTSTTTHKPSSTTKRPATTKRPKPSRPSNRPTHRPTMPSTTTTEAPPPSPPEACTDGQYYPVREACDQYEVCVNGQLLRLRCAPGLLFNHVIGVCDWAHNVQCHTSQRMELEWSRKSAGCSKGQFTAHPSNCNQYLQCQWGAYQIYSCPPGLHWNAKNNICDWPSRSTCRVTSPSNPQSGSKPDNKPPSGSSKPVSLATTSTNRPEWEWKPDTTSTSNPQWEWKPETTPKPKPIPNKPSKPSGKHPLANGPFKVVCYFTNWAWYRTGPAKYLPEDIDTNLCTHVLYGFAVLDFENLIIKAHDSWADFDNKFYERVVAMKKKGVHVLLAIGGWNDSQGDKYSRLVNNAASRQRFIQHVVPFLLKYDFDGLDLDWEYPKCWQVNCDKGPASDKESFGLFVKELKTAFRSHDLLLSAAVSPSKAVIDEGYDVKTMAKYLDWISVMTYDYHGQWDKKTGHLAPMYYHPEDDFDYFNANYSINYWLSEGVPKHKLVMGMPLYGQSFTLAKREQHGLNAPAPGPGQAGESTRAAGFLAYYEICSRIKNGGWTVVQDEEQRMGPYAYNGDQWISFDDKDTIRRKSEWIREMGIGGGMIWALDLDDFRNTCGGGKHPLLTIIAKTLAKPGQGGMATPTPAITTTTPEPSEQTTLESSGAATTPIHPATPPDVAEPEKPTQPTSTTTEETEEVEATTEDELEEETTTTSTTTTTTTTKRPRPAKPGKPTKPKPKPKPKPTSTTTEKPKPEVEDHFKVVCYFTNWAWYRQGEGKYLPSDIDPELCTHIIYGFAVLDSDHLTIKPHDTWADFDNKFYEKVIAVKKKKSNIKVLIAIGGWNDSAGDKYSRLVNSAAARQRFVQHVLEFIQEHGFDGLDLDWEYPKCWQVNCQQGPDSDKESFAAFVKELHEAFQPHGLLLSAAVSPSRTVITAGYDVKALSKYLDWISVMAYDYHGQWDKVTGHVAPMYAHPEDDDVTFNTNFTMHYWMRQGADRRKLIVGMPMYGQSFSLASTDDNGLNAPTYGGGEAGEQTRARGFLAYYEICQRTLKQGWEVVRDEEGRIGPYARLRDQWVSFDDQAMIAYKSNYVKSNDFGGAMIWALDLDDFRNLCGCEEYPLLKTINRVLRNYPGVQPECRLSPAQDGDNAESAVTEFPERNNEVEGASEMSNEEDPECVNGVMAHPGDCNKYYSCWNNGQSRTQLNCPQGLHFDSVRNICEWPDKAVCWNSAKSRLQQQEDEQTSLAFQGTGPASYFAGKFPWSSLQQGIPVWFARI